MIRALFNISNNRPAHPCVPNPNYKELSLKTNFSKRELRRIYVRYCMICRMDGLIGRTKFSQIPELIFLPLAVIAFDYESARINHEKPSKIIIVGEFDIPIKKDEKTIDFDGFIIILSHFSCKATGIEKVKYLLNIMKGYIPSVNVVKKIENETSNNDTNTVIDENKNNENEIINNNENKNDDNKDEDEDNHNKPAPLLNHSMVDDSGHFPEDETKDENIEIITIQNDVMMDDNIANQLSIEQMKNENKLNQHGVSRHRFGIVLHALFNGSMPNFMIEEICDNIFENIDSDDKNENEQDLLLKTSPRTGSKEIQIKTKNSNLNVINDLVLMELLSGLDLYSYMSTRF